MVLKYFIIVNLVNFCWVTSTTPRSQLLASVTRDEQRAWIKIECVAGTPPADIARRLNAILGDQAFSERHIMRLCQEFTQGMRLESVCQPPPGRPRTATSQEMMDSLLAFLVDNDGATCNEIAYHLNVSYASANRMLHELRYVYAVGRYVPHELDDSQRARRVQTAQENLASYNSDQRLLDRIIAIDETWLPSYLPLTDSRAGQWVPPGEEP